MNRSIVSRCTSPLVCQAFVGMQVARPTYKNTCQDLARSISHVTDTRRKVPGGGAPMCELNATTSDTIRPAQALTHQRGLKRTPISSWRVRRWQTAI